MTWFINLPLSVKLSLAFLIAIYLITLCYATGCVIFFTLFFSAIFSLGRVGIYLLDGT